MTRSDLKGKIQTVLGPIEPQALSHVDARTRVVRHPPARHAVGQRSRAEITLENVWQMNYGRGLKRAGRKYMSISRTSPPAKCVR